jgi:hypothetical protein
MRLHGQTRPASRAAPDQQGQALGELAAAGGDHQAAFAEYNRVMRPFITVNHALGMQSAQFMTQDFGERAGRAQSRMFDFGQEDALKAL